MENSSRFEELVSDLEKRLNRQLEDKEKELLVWILEQENSKYVQ